MVAAPGRDCAFCPRLVAFRRAWRDEEPGWFNAPVPSFLGPAGARLLVVGLAPGLRGANRTGRAFTGDGAGALLFSALLRAGFAQGRYRARADDGLELLDCHIANAVRCVPPGNRPSGAEIRRCNRFLADEIGAMGRLRAILALGGVAHGAVLRALALRPGSAAFAHGALHRLEGGLAMVDSYHCSRLNVNTGRLTEAMFHAVLATVRGVLEDAPGAGVGGGPGER